MKYHNTWFTSRFWFFRRLWFVLYGSLRLNGSLMVCGTLRPIDSLLTSVTIKFNDSLWTIVMINSVGSLVTLEIFHDTWFTHLTGFLILNGSLNGNCHYHSPWFAPLLMLLFYILARLAAMFQSHTTNRKSWHIWILSCLHDSLRDFAQIQQHWFASFQWSIVVIGSLSRNWYLSVLGSLHVSGALTKHDSFIRSGPLGKLDSLLGFDIV